MLIYCCCLLDPAEEAILKLTNHFHAVIDGILDQSWRHFTSSRTRKGVGRFSYELKVLNTNLVFNGRPYNFLLQPQSLHKQLVLTRDKVVKSLRQFDFELYTPVLSAVFGPTAVTSQGSGIDVIFPRKPLERARKPRLSANVAT